MTNPKRFPVLNHYRKPSERNWILDSIPWAFAETFRYQAEKNHHQTLERLAERGGLSPREIYAAAIKLRLCDVFSVPEQAAVDWIKKQIEVTND